MSTPALIPLPPILRGDDWHYIGTFSLSSGGFTGCYIWLTLKTNISQADSAAALQITTDSGIIILSDTTLDLTFTAAQTAALQPRTHFVDIQVKTPAGKIITVENLAQTTVVSADVTRAIT